MHSSSKFEIARACSAEYLRKQIWRLLFDCSSPGPAKCSKVPEGKNTSRKTTAWRSPEDVRRMLPHTKKWCCGPRCCPTVPVMESAFGSGLACTNVRRIHTCQEMPKVHSCGRFRAHVLAGLHLFWGCLQSGTYFQHFYKAP